MPSPFAAERAVAVDAVRAAARLCRSVASRLQNGVMEKSDKSPVTVADFGSQALICAAIQEAFPDDPVVAEESSEALREPGAEPLLERVTAEVKAQRPGADTDRVCRWIDRGGHRDHLPDRYWTLDPIDGTKGFLRGDQYAVALALIVDGALQVAALACPNLPLPSAASGHGSLLSAVRGVGAMQEPLDDGTPPRGVDVSGVSEPAFLRFCESVESGHTRHDASANIAAKLGVTASPHRIDSQCKYAAVARGDAEVYLRLPTKPGYVEKIWDHAAGALIVEEAGGRVTDLDGNPLNFSLGAELSANRGVVVTHGPLHDRVLEAARAVLGPTKK